MLSPGISNVDWVGSPCHKSLVNNIPHYVSKALGSLYMTLLVLSLTPIIMCPNNPRN